MTDNNRNYSDKNKVPDFQFEYGVKPSNGKTYKFIYEIRENGLAYSTYTSNRKPNLSLLEIKGKQELIDEIKFNQRVVEKSKRDCEESARIVREGISVAYGRGLSSNEIRQFWEGFDREAESFFSEIESLKIMQQMAAESEPLTKEVLPKKWEFVNDVSMSLRTGIVYTRAQLQNLAASNYGITEKDLVKELTELAYLNYALYQVSTSDVESVTYNRLVATYNQQANSSLRTSESIMLQQYSTPLPMSYLLGCFCGFEDGFFEKKKTIFEPTAGNGFLLVAMGYRTIGGSLVNEVSENRYENLKELSRSLKFTVSQRDATDPKFYAELPQYDAVIANPPFAKMDRMAFDQIRTEKIDHWIILNALSKMKDSGKAAFVIGGHTTYDSEGRINSRNKTTGDRYFFNYLYHHYNVVDIVNVNGELYSRQGTQFDIRLILIDGRKQTPSGFAPLKEKARTEVVQDWQGLWQRVSAFFPTEAPPPKSDELVLKLKLMAMKAKALELELELLSL